MSLKDSHNHHSEYSKIIVSLAHPSLKLAPRSWPLELGTFASPDHSWDSHIFGTCPEVTVNMLYGLAQRSTQTLRKKVPLCQAHLWRWHH